MFRLVLLILSVRLFVDALSPPIIEVSCPVGEPLIDPYYCGSNQPPCPANYTCVSEPTNTDITGRCCLDCTKALCPRLFCNNSYVPEGQCCQVCPEKPGACPAPAGVGICINMCNDDYDCPNDTKCCSNGCGKTCQNPLDICATVRCAKPDCDNFYTPEGECCPVCPKEKLGVCPASDSFNRVCITVFHQCDYDHDCKDDMKCCMVDGCGRECMLPNCEHGQNGTCGGIAGFQCPEGSTCMFMPTYPDAMGTCCLDQKTPKPLSACILPRKIGPCRGAITRYFYNTVTCQCESFSWGGCDPNENNFADLAHCQSSCEVPMKSNPICELPKISGPCEAYMTRYWYNTSSCKCEEFIYGGCGANANNFLTLEWCNTNCNCHDCKDSTDVCTLPIKPHDGGPLICQAYIPSYGYNSTSCKCEKFIYSGCGGNDNRFSTLEACENRCGDSCVDVCKQPIKPHGGGEFICLAYIPSYGYNSTSCQCEQFIYTGCGGNDNRFGTLEECNKRCSDSECETQVFCEAPADPGLCKAYMPRFFYNKKTCKCEEFIYGGCGGNKNNFLSQEACENACHGHSICKEEEPDCLSPEDSGPCKALIKRFHYDPLTCKCKEFDYGGCGGNDNNYNTKRKCLASCRNTTCPVCNLPKAPGPCKGSFKRFFFNIQTCQCESFIYGGCGGNENRYETLEDCQAICGSIKCPVCNAPPIKGSCKANKKRWYFDAVECKCKTFVYGGCGGNMNRFLTKEDCEGSCGTYPCPVCSQPMKVGPCRAAIPRFYYDPLSNKCKQFSWGGCQPNGNNFMNWSNCQKVCKGFVCSLPMKVGPCKGSKPRYYYDSKSGTCKKFYWGGCDSNGNNFKTLKGCHKKCIH